MVTFSSAVVPPTGQAVMLARDERWTRLRLARRGLVLIKPEAPCLVRHRHGWPQLDSHHALFDHAKDRMVFGIVHPNAHSVARFEERSFCFPL